MNAFSTAAIPFLGCGITFTVIGLAQGGATFLGMGLAFLAAGVPMLVLGVTRRKAQAGRGA
mgnify:CR=1 FL=1